MDSPNYPSAEKIRQAVGFIRAGQKEQARLILREILLNDSNNLTVWELLSRATINKTELVYCLKHILNIQPDHAWARRELDQLEPPIPPADTPKQDSKSPEDGKANLRDELGLSSPTTQAPLPVSPAPQSSPPLKEPPKKKRRNLPLVLYISGALGVLCVALWGYYLLVLLGSQRMNSSQRMTQTADALQQANCQVLIDEAMQAAGTSCDKLGGNSVCYGNFTIQSKLVPGSTDPFSQRGDIINIRELLQLSASPLNISNHQWGIAIFKVMANLPRSLPGETVTLMVFGNTTLDNQSPSLETFYFSSQLGQVVCDKVPFDGITIDTPEGSGETFRINGTELTLMGNASLTANPGGNMNVSLYSGSGKIVANGQEQYFGAGQRVSVQLGGDNGMQAIGGPSAPVALSQAEMQIACTMYGKYCSAAEITPVSVEQAQANIQSGLGPTPSITATASLRPSASTTPAPTLTPTLTLTRTSTPTFTKTATRTLTRTATRTLTRTATRTQTTTPTRTATPVYTATASGTGIMTATATPTFSPTPTPSDTSTDTPIYTPTDTPIYTPTDTPTATTIPPSATPVTPTPSVYVSIIVPASDGTTLTDVSQTDFEAQAWDTSAGTGNGDGIIHVYFWFSDSHGHHVPGLPDVHHKKREDSVKYCAFSGLGTCNTMNPFTFSHLTADTYTMYVQAYGVSGTSGVIPRTFVIP